MVDLAVEKYTDLKLKLKSVIIVKVTFFLNCSMQRLLYDDIFIENLSLRKIIIILTFDRYNNVVFENRKSENDLQMKLLNMKVTIIKFD